MTERVKCSTPDLADETAKKILELVPECAGENGEVDFDKLRQALSSEPIEGNVERYEFTWPGKRAAKAAASAATTKTLRPCRDESVDFDKTGNLYIEGNNLEVLKLLQSAYAGKVKMIYLDPPYNTGHDFVYRDRFSLSQKEADNAAGALTEDGDLYEVNDSSEARYHSNWCSMMWPRLKLARNLLRDDGVIFISIDDNEVVNLKKICDEVFGLDSFINLIVIKTKDSSGASGGGEDKRLKKNVEFVLCYGKAAFKAFNPVYGKIPLLQYIKDYDDSGRSFKYTTVYTKLGERTYYKTIKDGIGADIIIYKHSGYETKSVSRLATDLGITEEEVYKRYLDRICTTENAQTSIRTRVQEATDTQDNLYSIDYYPISGRNKGTLTTIYFVGPQNA